MARVKARTRKRVIGGFRMTFKSINEMETQILSLVNQNETVKTIKAEISDYELTNLTDRVKRYFLNSLVEQFNIWKMKKHYFESGQEEYRNLFYHKDFNFENVKEQVKTFFSKFGKEDKIKEVTPNLKIEKYFNPTGIKYFSLWDFKKSLSREIDNKWTLDKEKARSKVSKDINDKKEVCVICYIVDNYRKAEYVKEFFDFLYLAYDLESLKEDKTESLDFRNMDNFENEEVKIRFCKEWAYITIKDQEKQIKFKSLMIENVLKRLEIT